MLPRGHLLPSSESRLPAACPGSLGRQWLPFSLHFLAWRKNPAVDNVDPLLFSKLWGHLVNLSWMEICLCTLRPQRKKNSTPSIPLPRGRQWLGPITQESWQTWRVLRSSVSQSLPVTWLMTWQQSLVPTKCPLPDQSNSLPTSSIQGNSPLICSFFSRSADFEILKKVS